jgi:hypothetical protein
MLWRIDPLLGKDLKTNNKNKCCLATDSKHVNDIWAIAGQLPITTIAKLLEAVFSVGSTPKLYNEDPRPAELNWDSWESAVEFRSYQLRDQCSVESWPVKRKLGGWCEMATSLAVDSSV